MAVEENSPYHGFEDNEDGGADSFTEHDELMRSFRASHPAWAAVRVAYLGMTAPYGVGRSLAETGGSAGPMDEDYWATLVPTQDVTARRFTFN